MTIPAVITWRRKKVSDPRDFYAFDLSVWKNLTNTFQVRNHIYVTEGIATDADGDISEDIISFPTLSEALYATGYLTPVNVRPADRFIRDDVKFDWLGSFKHPEDACYVFGPNVGDAPLANTDHNVAIDLGGKTLHAFTAASILFMDRRASLTLNAYQEQAMRTAVYPSSMSNPRDSISYAVMALAGEAGELCNVYKKVLRDNNALLTAEKRDRMIDELGDVQWYVAAVAHELDITLEDVAGRNLQKLADRCQRAI